MKFEVKFRDIFQAKNEEEVYAQLIQYLAECVQNEDCIAFDIEPYSGPDKVDGE